MPPTPHAEPVDHRRVRVGADERVRVGLGQRAVALTDEHDAREVLEVDLVDDAGVGGHDREALEGVLAPAQEGVALGVALELARGVAREGVAGAEDIDLDGVVDHQLGRHERADRARIAAHLHDRIAHRGEVDDGGDAGEVLEQHARRHEGDLGARLRGGLPRRERFDVGRAYRPESLVAQQVLEQDLQRERQAGDAEAGLERVEAEDLQAPPRQLDLGTGVEAVGGFGHVVIIPQRGVRERSVRHSHVSGRAIAALEGTLGLRVERFLKGH